MLFDLYTTVLDCWTRLCIYWTQFSSFLVPFSLVIMTTRPQPSVKLETAQTEQEKVLPLT